MAESAKYSGRSPDHSQAWRALGSSSSKGHTNPSSTNIWWFCIPFLQLENSFLIALAALTILTNLTLTKKSIQTCHFRAVLHSSNVSLFQGKQRSGRRIVHVVNGGTSNTCNVKHLWETVAQKPCPKGIVLCIVNLSLKSFSDNLDWKLCLMKPLCGG